MKWLVKDVLYSSKTILCTQQYQQGRLCCRSQRRLSFSTSFGCKLSTLHCRYSRCLYVFFNLHHGREKTSTNLLNPASSAKPRIFLQLLRIQTQKFRRCLQCLLLFSILKQIQPIFYRRHFDKFIWKFKMPSLNAFLCALGSKRMRYPQAASITHVRNYLSWH